MKIIQAIDSFFASFEQRLAWVETVVLGWWLWQFVWLGFMMVDLWRVRDVDALFEFYESMNRYSAGLFPRIAFAAMNAKKIVSAFTPGELFLLVLSLGLVVALRKKAGYFLAGLVAGLLGWIAGWMVVGLQCVTITAALKTLSILSAGGILFCAGFVILGLFQLVILINTIGNMTNKTKIVHDS